MYNLPMNLTRVISDIKQELFLRPFDALHDVSHHYETWKNSLEIITSKRLELNFELRGPK